MDVLGEVLHEEAHRFVTAVLGYQLVVIKHQYHPMGYLSELVYEHGKHCLDEPLPRSAYSHKNIGSEVLSWRNPAQRFYYVPPHPDRIVVLLVDGDPSETQASFSCLMPLG